LFPTVAAEPRRAALGGTLATKRPFLFARVTVRGNGLGVAASCPASDRSTVLVALNTQLVNSLDAVAGLTGLELVDDIVALVAVKIGPIGWRATRTTRTGHCAIKRKNEIWLPRPKNIVHITKNFDKTS
jgi:hypothetical protein